MKTFRSSRSYVCDHRWYPSAALTSWAVIRTALPSRLTIRPDNSGPLDAARRHVERPGKEDHDGKACTERHHHECQRPVWKMERVADGLRYLQHREGRDAVSDQGAKYAPALELGEQGQEHQASVSVRGTRSLPLQTGLRGGTLCLPTSARFRCALLRGRNCSDLAWPRRTCDRRVRGKRRAKAD